MKTTLDQDLLALEHDIDALIAERQHIAEVLAAFYAAPVTISSLQPILALCVELNPALKVKP